MPKRGKRYRAALERVDRTRAYGPRRALTLTKDVANVGFDPTVNVAFRLGVDPRKADQMVRGAVVLPHGTGRPVSVAVIAVGEKATEAREAGADIVGGDDVIEQLSKGELIDELDTVIATPDQMGKLGRLGKLLGPRGLMPNPKSGTVTMDVAKAVQEVKAGKIEYRTDRQGNVHAVIGKASFTTDQLLENYQAVFDELLRQRPASAKGRYMRNITVSTTMGPGIRVDPARTRDLFEDDLEAAAS
ncbi:MAG TPA: 50S ribosomal protein L1 [Nitriliruptorales bacterium]|nr:50S ribosomal protein L1 [Nitriliruptorales bacterium]